MEFSIESYEEIDSTNAAIKHLIDIGATQGRVVRAACQTGGYGRQGRTWTSPFGGSYQSLLLKPTRPREEWPTLTLVVGLAVCKALKEMIGSEDPDIFVKWPNDVMTSQGKIVGISSEVHGGSICLGTGVNVFRPADPVEVTGKNTPVYLIDLIGDKRTCSVIDIEGREENDLKTDLIQIVGDKVLEYVSAHYEIWERCGFKAFVDEYRRSNGIIGCFVDLMHTDGAIVSRGRVLDINECGQVVIEDEKGVIQAYFSGEVHLCN